MSKRSKASYKQPRTRRDPFERALVAAKKALDRYQALLEKCQKQVIECQNEIPRLRGIIGALSPNEDRPKNARNSVRYPPNIIPAIPKIEGVPDHLQRAMAPIETVDLNSPAEDKFLIDQSGEEILS
jgi:hypothetical protein